MGAMPQILTAKLLRRALQYNPETGVFIRKVTAGPAHKGDVAGSLGGHTLKTRGRGALYILIWVYGYRYRAHNLAWLYMTGEWPTLQVDHKNRIKTDNRWENLRAATDQQNRANRGPNRDNKCGFKGVRWHPKTKKWAARIRIAGKEKSLGYYFTARGAADAYRRSAHQEHGEFAYPL